MERAFGSKRGGGNTLSMSEKINSIKNSSGRNTAVFGKKRKRFIEMSVAWGGDNAVSFLSKKGH